MKQFDKIIESNELLVANHKLMVGNASSGSGEWVQGEARGTPLSQGCRNARENGRGEPIRNYCLFMVLPKYVYNLQTSHCHPFYHNTESMWGSSVVVIVPQVLERSLCGRNVVTTRLLPMGSKLPRAWLRYLTVILHKVRENKMD